MKLIKEKLRYIIENTDEIRSNRKLAELLSMFLDEESELIFSCNDMKDFFKNLQNEDIKTQIFYKKFIEFNKSRGHEIFRDDEIERESKKFIKERTVFINYESNLGLEDIFCKKRKTIWYKVNTIEEIITALNMEEFFTCIMLKKGRDFYDYSYIINQVESEIGKDIFFIEKEKGSFMKDVYPRICEKFELNN